MHAVENPKSDKWTGESNSPLDDKRPRADRTMHADNIPAMNRNKAGIVRYPHFYPQAQAGDTGAKRRNSVHNRHGDIFVNNHPRSAKNRPCIHTKDNPDGPRALSHNLRKTAPNTCIYGGKSMFSLLREAAGEPVSIGLDTGLPPCGKSG